MKRAILGTAILFFIAATAFGAAKIEIKNAWIRETPPASSVAAVYMVIENEGGEDDRLIGVSADVSKYAEIHSSSVDKEGMTRMVKVDALDTPSGKSVQLKPGGNHIMLIELKRPLKAGDKAELDLRFKKSGVMKVQAEVKEIAGGHTTQHEHH